jgi:hypothetical protein
MSKTQEIKFTRALAGRLIKLQTRGWSMDVLGAHLQRSWKQPRHQHTSGLVPRGHIFISWRQGKRSDILTATSGTVLNSDILETFYVCWGTNICSSRGLLADRDVQYTIDKSKHQHVRIEETVAELEQKLRGGQTGSPCIILLLFFTQSNVCIFSWWKRTLN